MSHGRDSEGDCKNGFLYCLSVVLFPEQANAITYGAALERKASNQNQIHYSVRCKELLCANNKAPSVYCYEIKD